MSMSGVLPDPQVYRRTELRLLVLVAAITTFALAAVDLNQQRPLDWQVVALGVGYLALFAGGHIAIRRFADHADPLLLPCAALLNGLGLVLNHRLDISNPSLQTHPLLPPGSAPAQVLWTAVALGMFAAVLWSVPDHRQLGRYTYTAGLLGLFLLVLPGLLPSSISQVNGAKLWLRIGPFSIQPGEFAKILIIVFAAGFLIDKRELFTKAGRQLFGMDLPRARDMAPLLAAWGLSIGVLALEKELGASLLYFGIVLVMLYIATERGSWLVIGLLFFTGGSVFAYYAFPHVHSRVEVWADPFAFAQTTGAQLIDSLFGLADGGVFGTGLGRGQPELVPFANTDFIISTVGEELGLVGLAAVLVLYAVLFGRGVRAAMTVRDSFGTLLAGGLAFGLALQVFIVVGGVTQLFPLTGMTVPFLSYGGSSLLSNFVLVALLLRVSDASRRPQPSLPREPQTPLAEAHTEMVDRVD
jgi:cell division protein FtsW (lipid II flippase)